MYIVELEKGVWAANWDGDPGRTIVQGNAKQFKTLTEAELKLEVCRTYRPFKRAQIIKLK